MVRKSYTEEQIIAVLNEAEAGARTADLSRKHGMSDASYLLQLEGQPCGPDGKRAQVAQVYRGRESASQADCGRSGFRHLGHSRTYYQETPKAQGEENGGSWAEREEGLSADRCITLGLSLKRRIGVTIMNSARGCVSWLGESSDWAVPGCTSCSRGRGWWSTTSARSASIVKRGLLSGGREDVEGRQELGGSFLLPNGTTRSGTWTSLVKTPSRGDASEL